MYYQIKIKYNKLQGNGTQKSVSETYVTNVDFFSQAEETGLKLIADYGLEDGDVYNIQRMPSLDSIVEDDMNSSFDTYYKVTLAETLVKDDCSEEEKRFDLLVLAEDAMGAMVSTNKFISKSAADLSVVTIKKTKIENVI